MTPAVGMCGRRKTHTHLQSSAIFLLFSELWQSGTPFVSNEPATYKQHVASMTTMGKVLGERIIKRVGRCWILQVTK